MTLRPAAPSDIDVILPMMKVFYAHESIEFDEERQRTALRQFLADPSRGGVSLIEVNGEASGYVVLATMFSLEFGGQAAFIDELYIEASKRREGLGRATIEALESSCRAAGITALRLEVDHSNHAARRLYERLGFVSATRDIMTRTLG
jgi:ribosomal protein S18 acetylase RimI-like enzyme